MFQGMFLTLIQCSCQLKEPTLDPWLPVSKYFSAVTVLLSWTAVASCARGRACWPREALCWVHQLRFPDALKGWGSLDCTDGSKPQGQGLPSWMCSRIICEVTNQQLSITEIRYMIKSLLCLSCEESSSFSTSGWLQERAMLTS